VALDCTPIYDLLVGWLKRSGGCLATKIRLKLASLYFVCSFPVQVETVTSIA